MRSAASSGVSHPYMATVAPRAASEEARRQTRADRGKTHVGDHTDRGYLTGRFRGCGVSGAFRGTVSSRRRGVPIVGKRDPGRHSEAKWRRRRGAAVGLGHA
jgi:hypothetical protein